MKKNYILFALLLIILITEIRSNSVQSIIDSTEAYARQGANRAKTLFENRCKQEITDCTKKVYNFCSDNIPSGMESVRSNIKGMYCEDPGLSLNYKVQGGRCSIYSKCDTEFDKRIICSSGSFYDDESLRKGKTDKIIYSYFGYTNSYLVSYPYRHESYDCEGKCVDYDPRYRPWYVGAITGAKNVLIIVDFSGSMDGTKIQKAKEATIQVLNTLGQSDWFQVVFFGTDAQSATGDNFLLKATNENKEKVINLVKEQSLIGATNFEEAFRLAFSLIENTREMEFVSYNCQTIMLFMTDGQITQGEENQSTLLNQIRTKNASYQASIFTYSFGEEADTVITSAIACANNGVWAQVTETNIGDAMASYYNFLAVGVSRDTEQQVLWSEIYKDSGLGVEMITATVPIYFEDQGAKKLLGVFGADLLVSDLDKYSDFRSTVYPQISSRARKQCTQNTLDSCKLEQYRTKKCFSSSHCNVDPEAETSLCSFNIQTTPWNSSGDQKGAEQTICATDNIIQRECDSANILKLQITVFILLCIAYIL